MGRHSLPRSKRNHQVTLAHPFDWRGWIVLAWVLWFGLLYGKMVVESRGHRVRELVPHCANLTLISVFSPYPEGCIR